MRVESAKPMKNGGWAHGEATAPLSIPRRQYQPKPQFADLGQLAAEYSHRIDAGTLARLCNVLGMAGQGLVRIGVGWDGAAWTFPMRDDSHRVIGIRRRFPDGRKLSVKGGHEGCFVPLEGLGDMTDLVLVCEGPTDTAAMLELGFEAIGRPSCSGGVSIVKSLTKGREVAIIADDDEPGLRGANRLADELWSSNRDVKVVVPLAGKDARDWARSASADEVQAAIMNAWPHVRRVA